MYIYVIHACHLMLLSDAVEYFYSQSCLLHGQEEKPSQKYIVIEGKHYQWWDYGEMDTCFCLFLTEIIQ